MKIIVKDENNNDIYLINDFKYIQIVNFLKRLKIVHGNDFLNTTLRKHPKIYYSLLEYEKKRIIEIERDLNNSTGGYNA